MRFRISIPAFADFSDPRVLAELAHNADVEVTELCQVCLRPQLQEPRQYAY